MNARPDGPLPPPHQLLEERKADLLRRKKELERQVKNIAFELSALEQDRIALDRAETITENLLRGREIPRVARPGLLNPRQKAGAGKPAQTRARIGDKRYALLATLRNEDRPMTVAELEEKIGWEGYRIREQLKAERTADPPTVELATVTAGQTMMRYPKISEAGRQLLTRFETAQKAHGKDLPPLRCRPAEAGDQDQD